MLPEQAISGLFVRLHYTQLLGNHSKSMRIRTTQIDPLFTNLCKFAIRKDRQVVLQCTSMENSPEPFLVVFETKEDVFADSCILDPRDLRGVGNGATDSH